MDPLYYIIPVSILLILVLSGIIFGSLKIFIKALLDNFLSDFDLAITRKWEKEHDIRHKLNLFYAVVIGVLLCAFLIYRQL